MINFANRTQYSFRLATGKLEDVLKTNQEDIVGICDRASTWGHLDFIKACKEHDKIPLLGVELPTVANCDDRAKQPISYTRLFAKNQEGLRELHELTTLSTEKFYYVPRIDYSILSEVSTNLIVVLGAYWDESYADDYMARDNFYVALDTQSNTWHKNRMVELYRPKLLACSNNYYPAIKDLPAHQVTIGMNNYNMITSPATIMSTEDWIEFFGEDLADIPERTRSVFDDCTFDFPVAEMVTPETEQTLAQMCQQGALELGVDLDDAVYAARLKRELDLIEDKKFEDYFYVVADLIAYAKTKMFVGPARGSSCGSLVCYLIGITDVDPIPYDLLFERFIDINRMDYPDIDIDFEDTKREMVYKYLCKKYGSDCVSKLGTISVFKAKSAITDVSKALSIPVWEVSDLKEAIIERSGGDSRAAFCLLDTFQQLDVGKETLNKYPELKVVADIEHHARHTGVHAAGIIVTDKPTNLYCSVDEKSGCAMIDKHNAEAIGMLKIDVLGLRTLSVLQDVLDQVGMTRNEIKNWKLDDEKAFEIINKKYFAGVFQFEGTALQNICQQIKVESFDDITAITALGRPGPLISGGTTEYIKRKNGEPATPMHPLVKEYTETTYGIIVYQEQVMQVARSVGKLSWGAVSKLRKAMSKSLGQEFFDKFYEKFEVGAIENGLDKETSRMIWDKINTMGSWAFNRSHAVAYGLISYWCMVLKAHYPLEFAAACLRNAKDEDQSIRILRELSKEGYDYKPYDADKSLANWSVQDGNLVGGLIGIKGIGDKMAKSIIDKRSSGEPMSKRQTTLLTSGTTPWDSIWECKELWGHIKAEPQKYNITSKMTDIGDITISNSGEFVVIGKLMDKNLRDHNEPVLLERRGGKIMHGQSLFFGMSLQDDTGNTLASIDRHKYMALAKPIVETGKIGDWYLVKAVKKEGWTQLFVNKILRLTGNDRFKCG